MSNNEASGGLHAPNVDDVLEHNGEDEFFRTQDNMTPFYLGLQKNQVVNI